MWNDRSCARGRGCGSRLMAAGVLALLGSAAPSRAGAADDDRSQPWSGCSRRPTRAMAMGGAVGGGHRRAAAAQLCPLARAAGEQGPAAVRRLRRIPARRCRLAQPRHASRRAPRRRWTRPSRSTSVSPSSPTATPRTRQGRILYAEALIAAGRRDEAVELSAAGLGRGRFRRGRGAAVPRALRRGSATGGPRRPARPPALGRPDRSGASHVAAGRRRRAGPGRPHG